MCRGGKVALAMARILSVSYDVSLLHTRQLILQQPGHDVISAFGFAYALKHGNFIQSFDIFILGHSMPTDDKEALISDFRKHCPGGAVIALRRNGERPVIGADYEIEPEPKEIVDVVARIASSITAAA